MDMDNDEILQITDPMSVPSLSSATIVLPGHPPIKEIRSEILPLANHITNEPEVLAPLAIPQFDLAPRAKASGEFPGLAGEPLLLFTLASDLGGIDTFDPHLHPMAEDGRKPLDVHRERVSVVVPHAEGLEVLGQGRCKEGDEEDQEHASHPAHRRASSHLLWPQGTYADGLWRENHELLQDSIPVFPEEFHYQLGLANRR